MMTETDSFLEESCRFSLAVVGKLWYYKKKSKEALHELPAG